MKIYMALTCKVGAYNRVLKELLDLHIPLDVFVLYGPIDILVQFTGFESLTEFIEKGFNPVKMIGADEGLITKTMTLIVISEGPSFLGEPFAFLFFNTQPRHLERVQQDLLKIPEVISADTVFGPYDIICSVRAKDKDDFERVAQYIYDHVPTIEGSITSIIALIRI